MLDFAAMEAAFKTWLVGATGLASGRVVPRYQKLPQMAMPYVTFNVPMPRQAGGPDELRRVYDGARAAGHEIQYITRGQREFVVAVQCFTKGTVGGADGDGNLTARSYLSAALAALALPSVSDAFNAAGIAMVDVESSNDFTERLGPVGQGRAQLDVRFRCVDTASSDTGYIQTVNNPTPTYSGP